MSSLFTFPRQWREMLLALCLVAGVSTPVFADAEADWNAVVALDAGPSRQAKTEDQARTLVRQHLAQQETALRSFLAAHPADLRGFEARLRLARALQIRSDFDHSEPARVEAKQILDELEKTVTPEQRPELEFARISRLMRSLGEPTAARREELLGAVRRFQTAHLVDRRLAALLVEVATLFDMQPKVKETLLTDAQPLATSEELKGRIEDDLKRVRLLGQPIALKFTSVQNEAIDLENLRGKPVLVIFFADFSPPSTAALANVQRSVQGLPKGAVHILGVSLDDRREEVTRLVRAQNVAWPVAFDGRGWRGPLVRALGINTLPTVWLLDQRGRLRSLDALQGTVRQVRQLMSEAGSK